MICCSKFCVLTKGEIINIYLQAMHPSEQYPIGYILGLSPIRSIFWITAFQASQKSGLLILQALSYYTNPSARGHMIPFSINFRIIKKSNHTIREYGMEWLASLVAHHWLAKAWSNAHLVIWDQLDKDPSNWKEDILILKWFNNTNQDNKFHQVNLPWKCKDLQLLTSAHYDFTTF